MDGGFEEDTDAAASLVSGACCWGCVVCVMWWCVLLIYRGKSHGASRIWTWSERPGRGRRESRAASGGGGCVVRVGVGVGVGRGVGWS